MANNKYTKEELYKATSTVKRTLKNEFSKGIRSKITKSEVFDMIFPKLGLASRRTLWRSPYIDYLNDWYSKLEIELNTIQEDNYSLKQPVSTKNTKTVEDLIKIIAEKDKYIGLLEARIKKLSTENEELRVAYNGKYTKIDLEQGIESPF